jgi:N-acetylglucosamine-6-phosphate deacetylase
MIPFLMNMVKKDYKILYQRLDLHRKIRYYILCILAIFFSTDSFCQETLIGILYSDSKPVSITINEGRITGIRRIKKLPEGCRNLYIAPGFIDNQVNGFAGVSFTFGGEELTGEGVIRATRELWKTGVTTYLPTLTTNSYDLLKKNFIVLAQAKDDPSLLGSIAGFHLEGPYISTVDGYRGAHPLKYVRKPDWNEFVALNEASGNNILQVTVAPETEGAMEFISKCTGKGIVVALGHHNATAAQITAAVDRGARIATHLGNGCANMINRHNNPLWPQLADDRLMISVIGDGFHLNAEELRVFYKIKGSGKTIITSDVTSYAAQPAGIYVTSDADTIELTDEGMLRYPAQNVLYGSASPLKKGIGNMMKVTGCSLGEAIQMASTNSAQLYNLNDRGTIEMGKRADLILFEIIDNELIIRQTYVSGKLVYDFSEDR